MQSDIKGAYQRRSQLSHWIIATSYLNPEKKKIEMCNPSVEPKAGSEDANRTTLEKFSDVVDASM